MKDQHIQEVIKEFEEKFVRRSAFGVAIGAIDNLKQTAEQQVISFLTQHLTSTYNKGRTDEREEVVKKAEELMYTNSSGHPLHHGYYQAGLNDIITLITNQP